MLAIAFAIFWIPERHADAGRCRTIALVLTVLYPFYQPKMFTIPVFGVWPDVATGVYMIVFIMMAVGLNIVVGYAGLLDLGYVAFYATGAYTAAWFASLQFRITTWHFGAVGDRLRTCRGIHITIWLLLPLAGVITAFFGILIGLPTLRLRGDYLAIVTLGFGEIIRDRAQQRQLPRHRLQSDQRPERHHAARFDRLRSPPVQFDRRLPARELSRVLQRELPRAPDPVDRHLLLDGDRACSSSPFSARCACSTRGSAARGSPSVRTKPPLRRWASR